MDSQLTSFASLDQHLGVCVAHCLLKLYLQMVWTGPIMKQDEESLSAFRESREVEGGEWKDLPKIVKTLQNSKVTKQERMVLDQGGELV